MEEEGLRQADDAETAQTTHSKFENNSAQEYEVNRELGDQEAGATGSCLVGREEREAWERGQV